MRDVSSFNRIFLAVKPVDFRKQAHGLSILVEPIFKTLPNDSKVLFAFTNRRKNSMATLLGFNRFALWWKTLEEEKFRWPKTFSEVKTLQVRELKWLLDGIDLQKMHTHQKISFQSQGYAREHTDNWI